MELRLDRESEKKEIMFMLLLPISLRAKGMAYSSAVYIETELGSRLVIMSDFKTTAVAV